MAYNHPHNKLLSALNAVCLKGSRNQALDLSLQMLSQLIVSSWSGNAAIGPECQVL